MIYASRFLRYDEKATVQGPDVLVLQEELKQRGYSIVVNGIYDRTTEAAVKHLQQTLGLPTDGIVGPEIWNTLNLGSQKITVWGAMAERPSILINLSRRRLTFTINNSSTTYPVAIGKRSTPSPIGNWVIVQKAVNPGGPFGARWMRLSVPWGGYGIHGTNNPRSIGKRASHGCIRMYNEDVIKIYDLTPIGTPVSIVGNVYTGRVLKEGMSGNDVKQLQKDLRRLRYYKALIDGEFGPKTTQAVKSFQADSGLPSDGIVGPYTYFALAKAVDITKHSIEP